MKPIAVAFGDLHHADAALRWSAELASLTGAPLRVVSVYEPTYSEIAPDWYEDLVSQRRASVVSALAEVGNAGAVIDVVKSLQPFDTIAKKLIEHDVSVGVIGDTDAHGPGGFGAGHPANHLLHVSHHPIAVIRPGYEPLEGGTIVVGVDGSGANSVALRFAEDMAAAVNGTIHAVFAYDPVDDTFVLPEGWHRHSNEVRAEVSKITSVATKLYMAAGHPSEVLIEHAKRERAAAVVVGTRGRGGFHGLILGRVPSQLIAHATCPLIVVPE